MTDPAMIEAVARAIQERLSTVPRMVYGEVCGVLCGSLAIVAIEAARPLIIQEYFDEIRKAHEAND